MTQELKIPADVGAYCRQAALVLKSSENFLNEELEQQGAWAESDGEEDWLLEIPHESAKRTRKNLRDAAKFLDWLANHSEALSEMQEG